MGSASSVTDDASLALHVTRVERGGPAHAAGLRVYLDFITHVNGKQVTQHSALELKSLVDCGEAVQLVVLSLASLRHRTLSIAGPLLISIRLCNPATVATKVWHVLQVHQNSPASLAGIIQDEDYILDAQPEQLSELLHLNLRKPVPVIVYNAALDELRQVIVMPDDRWGGNGILGCDLGYGIMHRVALGWAKYHSIQDLTVKECKGNDCDHKHLHKQSSSHQKHDHQNHSHGENFGVHNHNDNCGGKLSADSLNLSDQNCRHSHEHEQGDMLDSKLLSVTKNSKILQHSIAGNAHEDVNGFYSKTTMRV